MHVIKSFFIAFSIYSKIPVPQFVWKEEDMRYTLCFFPLVGVLIGLCEWGWYLFCQHFSIGTLAFACIGTAIPICLSGGFHLDGYMDTMDALHSYQTREKKLAILKDPHIGAFSVIQLLFYMLLFVGAFSELTSRKPFLCMCAGFALSRMFSGLAILCMPSAKEDGMLAYFSKTVQKQIVFAVLLLQVIITSVFLWKQDAVCCVWVLLTVFAVFLFYLWKSKKEFGGITGDLAGCFVSLCELCVVMVMAVCNSIRFV